jgi:hypothetical protein
MRLASLVFPFWRATHQLDRKLLPNGGLSQAFEVLSPTAAAAVARADEHQRKLQEPLGAATS